MASMSQSLGVSISHDQPPEVSQAASSGSLALDLALMTGLPADSIDARMARWDADRGSRDITQSLKEIEETATVLEENRLLARSQRYLLDSTIHHYSLRPHSGFVGDATEIAIKQSIQRMDTLLGRLETSMADGGVSASAQPQVIDMNLLSREEKDEMLSQFKEENAKWGIID